MVKDLGEGVRRWLLAVERDPKVGMMKLQRVSYPSLPQVLESLERCCEPSSSISSCDTDLVVAKNAAVPAHVQRKLMKKKVSV